MATSYDLSVVVARDMVLRAAANKFPDLALFGNAFATSGFASALESSDFRKKDIGETAIIRITRGDSRNLIDPLATMFQITRTDGPIALFADDAYPELMDSMKAHKKAGSLETVILGQNSALFYLPSKGKLVQKLMGSIKDNVRSMKADSSSSSPVGSVYAHQIVARHRILYALGFEEDDVLAAVYDWFTRVNRVKQMATESQYIAALHTHDLFGKELCVVASEFYPPSGISVTSASARVDDRHTTINRPKVHIHTHHVHIPPDRVKLILGTDAKSETGVGDTMPTFGLAYIM